MFSSKDNDTKTNITEESRLQASLVLFLAIFYHPATDTPTQFTPAPLFHEDWWMDPNIRETQVISDAKRPFPFLISNFSGLKKGPGANLSILTALCWSNSELYLADPRSR